MLAENANIPSTHHIYRYVLKPSTFFLCNLPSHGEPAWFQEGY